MAKIDFFENEVSKHMIVSQFDFSNIPTTFKAAIFYVAINQESPLDCHEVRELWYVLEGTGELTYNSGQKIMLNEFDMFYFDRHVSHSIQNNSNKTLIVFSIWW